MPGARKRHTHRLPIPVIDRELPVMAVIALAVGLVLAIGINSFAGTDGSGGEELRTAADRPASNVAALRVMPRSDRPAAAEPRRRADRARRTRNVRRAAARTAPRAAPAALTPTPQPQQTPSTGTGPPASTPAPRPDPSPAPRPAPKPSGGGGSGQPFDDSG